MSFGVIRKELVVTTAVAALALPTAAGAATLHGVVVQHNQRAHSFVVAMQRGHLVSVHSRNSPALGRVVAVRARRLRDGTFAASHITARQQVRHRVSIHGVVTFVSRRSDEFTVSAGGASLLVRHARAAGLASDASASDDQLPSVGDEVTVQTQIGDQGDLEDQGVQDNGTQAQTAEVEGTILAIDPTADTLSVSADEDGQSGQSVTVDVPSTIDITQFQVGQEVKLLVSVQADGSFLLQGLSEDGDSHQANNPGDQQGCQGDGPGNSCSESDSGSGQGSSGQGDSGQGSSGSGDSGQSGSDQGGSDSDGSDGSSTGSSSGSD
jgi:hypothetical protein